MTLEAFIIKANKRNYLYTLIVIVLVFNMIILVLLVTIIDAPLCLINVGLQQNHNDKYSIKCDKII